MMTQQINKTLIKRIKVLTRTQTYKETATTLAKKGVKTPRGNRPTESFVNYVVSTYL